MVSIELKIGNYSTAINHLEKLSRVVKELGYGEKAEQSQFNVISCHAPHQSHKEVKMIWTNIIR